MIEYAKYWDERVQAAGAVTAVTRWDAAEYEAFYRNVLGIFRGASIDVIADVGCGPALLVPLLRELFPGAVYYGYDVSRKMIEYASTVHPTEQFKLIEQAFKIESAADLILCHSVFTHMHPCDAFAYLCAFRDGLMPGGVISASIHMDTEYDYSGDISRIDYNPTAFEGMVKSAGLVVLDYLDVNVPAGMARYYRLSE